jgi:hypothetical protein
MARFQKAEPTIAEWLGAIYWRGSIPPGIGDAKTKVVGDSERRRSTPLLWGYPLKKFFWSKQVSYSRG